MSTQLADLEKELREEFNTKKLEAVSLEEDIREKQRLLGEVKLEMARLQGGFVVLKRLEAPEKK